MCGIAGYISKSGTDITPEMLRTAMQAMTHRGPDDHGCFVWSPQQSRLGRDIPQDIGDARVAMVHRRLSIIDLSDNGWQPMQTPDGRYSIVFNGEIYNYVDLREQLKTRHEFRSHSDTEVLLAAFAAWGIESLQRLVGMFAFAIFDQQTQELFLARDFFGIKPLYYCANNNQFAFASEIQVLLDTVVADRRANPSALFRYLRFGATDEGEETLLTGVRHLPAAHYLRVPINEPSKARIEKFWTIDLDARQDISFDDAAAKLRDIFLESVSLHLRSDVPVGSALSGGVDSSSILCAARHILGPKADLLAISYVASEPRISEERWIDVVGQAAGADVHKVRLDPQSLLDDLQNLMPRQGEPFGSTSVWSQYRIFADAKRVGAKVMLDGQGGDELLAGYDWCYGVRLASLMRQGRFTEAFSSSGRFASRLGVSRCAVLQEAAQWLLPTSAQIPLRRLVGKDLLPGWVNGKWFRDHNVRIRPNETSGCRDLLRGQLQLALEGRSGLANLLRYEDRNSMAYSIESRVPFLTPRMAEFVLSLPEEYLISQPGVTKSVFRAAMRGIVPDLILDRTDKIGFTTPELNWLTVLGPWVESRLQSPTARDIPVLNLPRVLREWQDIAACKRPFDFRVWRWLSLIDWTERVHVQYA